MFIVRRDPRHRPIQRVCYSLRQAFNYKTLELTNNIRQHGPPVLVRARVPWVSDVYPVGSHMKRVMEKKRLQYEAVKREVEFRRAQCEW